MKTKCIIPSCLPSNDGENTKTCQSTEVSKAVFFNRGDKHCKHHAYVIKL